MSKNLKESMRITSQEMKTINKDRNYRLTEMIQYEEQEKKKKLNKNKQHTGLLEYYKKIHRGLTEANKKGQNI